MHSLLESYLTEVRAKLGPLPTKRCDEEMREMRGHLLDAVVVNRELGQSEDTAAANALGEFGPTDAAASGIIQAWENEQKLRRRDLVGAAACTMAFLLILPHLLFPLVKYYVIHAFQPHQLNPWLGVGLFLLQMPPYLLAGAVSGFAFPRRAVAGIGLALMALQLCFLVHSSLTIGHHSSILQLFVERLELFGLWEVLYLLVACLTAGVVGRWRKAQTGHPAAVAE